MSFSASTLAYRKPDVAHGSAPSGAGESQSLASLSAEFIRMKQASGFSGRTIQIYKYWLGRLYAQVGNDVSALDNAAVARFLANLRERSLSASTVHQAYRNLRTFIGWLVETGVLPHNPMHGLRVKTPAILPQVPTAEELKAVLGCCSDTVEGRRNFAAILFMADSGVRSEELRGLRIEHLNQQTHRVTVRGKGMRDRVVFIGSPTLEAIRDYRAMRPEVSGGDYLFADAQGRPLTGRRLVQILHRLSERAGLAKNRRLHPHALRHWSATSLIREGMGPFQVQRLLGHATLNTTLRYVSLVSEDVQQAHHDAAVIERLGILPERKPRARSRRPRTRQGQEVFADVG